MFTDGRSRRVIFLAHCLLNQNAISDGTADYPACNAEVVRAIMDAEAGMVQMPCPELCCLGLDRGNALGGQSPVVVENTRIRLAMQSPRPAAALAGLARQVLLQIAEYHRHGFELCGIVGVNRSPCCGVDTTSADNEETQGRGLFMAAIEAGLEQAGLSIPMVGIKSTPDAARRVGALL